MLTIAGGIILAVVLIVSAGIWLPLLIWLLVAAVVLGIIFGVISLIAIFPQESIAILKFIVGTIIFVYILIFLRYMIDGLQNWWKKRKILRPKPEVENVSDPIEQPKNELYEAGEEVENISGLLEQPKGEFIEPESCLPWGGIPVTEVQSPEDALNLLEQLKNGFASPGGLARNRNKTQMIELASKFGIGIAENDSKADIARKIFSGENESNEGLIENTIKPEEDKNEIGGDRTLLWDKIEEVKKKELARLKDAKEKAEEEKLKKEEEKLKKREIKRKKNEQLKKRFSKIHTAVMELKSTYSTDKDIRVLVYDFSAHLTLVHDWTITQRTMAIKLDNNEGFYIKDSNYKKDKKFNGSDEVINYIGEQLGIFLAERESR